MRVILDTNIILSAFLWQKKLKPIYQAIRLRKIIPCFSPTTWEELQRALSYKKFSQQLSKINITAEKISKLLSSRAHFVLSRLQITEIKADPSDNHILACALSSRACFIISGDKHLLNLKQFHNILIISPAKFIKELNL